MLDIFKQIDVQLQGNYEFRFHKMEVEKIVCINNKINNISRNNYIGIGIRCIYNGAVGFASTSSFRKEDIILCAKNALLIAKLNKGKKNFDNFTTFTEKRTNKSANNYDDISILNKIEILRVLNERMKKNSVKINSTYLSLVQQWNEKIIYTSDGTEFYDDEHQISLYMNAHSYERGMLEKCADSFRISGNWNKFAKICPSNIMVDDVSKVAVDKLYGVLPENGLCSVILSPKVVGTLVHEAIGHSVEADFVHSGSAANGRIGESVASNKVNIIDCGTNDSFPETPIKMEVDDEGIKCREVNIVKDGILRSFLHNRETATVDFTTPFGNARATRYFNEPIIRMRNTCMLPGNSDVNDSISSIKNGYYLKKIYNGQADINGDFNFSIIEGYKIVNGKLKNPLKDHIIYGKSFEVLKSVENVCNDFEWNAGICGKGQEIIVGQGGPSIKCNLKISAK